ncbi:MAG TPA: hypothetical protein DEB56_08040, partial [Thiobacillus sp.]|nr:hypothetical protein [Thiobacillus sp.]
MDYAVANFNTAGFSQSWDLGSYGGAFSTFTSAAVMADAEMNVFALDGTETAGAPGEKRLVSTTNGINAAGSAVSLTSATTPSNSNFNNIFGNVTVTNFLVAVNGSASHDSDANGASNANATSGNAWFDNGTGMEKFGNLSAFDSTNKFDGAYGAGTGVLAGQAKALPFYMVVASSTSGPAKAT